MTHAYPRLSAALVPAAVVMCAGAAQACAIEVQSCQLQGGGTAYYDGSVGNVVQFSERGDGADTRAVVVECTSRQALAISPPNPDDWNDFWDAERMIGEAVRDDEEQTLPQLARQIRRETGVVPQVFTLAQGHCGCDLPNIPSPPANCPVDF